MGGSNTKESPKAFEDVSKTKKYTLNQLKQWYRILEKQYPDHYISEAQFKELYTSFYPNGDASLFAEHNFRAFDTNNDTKIDFKEFLVALGVRCRGTVEEKLHWMFSLFDINNNQVITKNEMLIILKSVYASLDKQNANPEDQVDEIYKRLDKNHDQKLTLKEFLRLGDSDPELTEMLCGWGNE